MKKVYTHLKKIRIKYLLLFYAVFGATSTIAQTNFSSISFAQQNFVGVEEQGASYLAKGDFNNDNKIDIVTTNTSTNRLTIFRNSNGYDGSLSYATGLAPKAVAVADVNLDGKLDIIVANSGNYTLGIYKNISPTFPNTSIAFELVQTIPVAYYPSNIAIADVDRDNKPDIIVSCSGTKNVSVLTNNSFYGSFSFSSPKDFPTGPANPGSIAVGELDYSSDPSIDVAVINNSNSTFATLRNTTIRDRYTVLNFEITTRALNNSAPQKVIKIIDLNKDGKADIVMSGGTGGYRVFKNESAFNSGISLSSPIDILASGTRGDLGFDVADLDKDGLPELISVKDGNIAISRNLSTPNKVDATTFAPEVILNNDLRMQQLITADCNGDGRLDIVSVNYSNSSISVYLNNIGASEPVQNVTLAIEAKQFILNWDADNTDNLKSYQIEYGTAPNEYPFSITVPATQHSFVLEKPIVGKNYYFRIASITNNDYKNPYSDIVSGLIKFDQIITMPATNKIMLPSDDVSVGAVSTNPSIPIFLTSSNPDVLTIINGLAHPIKPGTAIITASQEGNPFYNPAQEIEQLVSVSFSPPHIDSLSQLSAKPQTEITIFGKNFGEQPVVYFGASQAIITSTTPNQLKVQVPFGTTYLPITVTDAATRLISNAVNAFNVTFPHLQTKLIDSVSFNETVSLPVNNNTATKVMVADLDNDGRNELIEFGSNNFIAITPNEANSNSEIKASYFTKKIVIDALPKTNVFALGDINGDGKKDLIAYYGYSLYVAFNKSTNGSFIFEKFNTPIIVNHNVVSLEIADADLDGMQDIIVGRENIEGHGVIDILKNTSTDNEVSFAGSWRFDIDNSPNFLAVRDLNGDGKPEIVSASNENNYFSILVNQSTSIPENPYSFALHVESIPGLSTNFIKTGDLDDDGKDEIITSYREASDNSSGILVFQNGSTASEMYFAKQYVPTGLNPSSADIIDFDGDGKPDLMVNNTEDAQLTFLKNKSVADVIDFELPFHKNVTKAVYSVASDFNNDGMPDVAYVDGQGKLSFLENIIHKNKLTPTNLTAEAVSTQITLNWNMADTTDLKSYQLEYGTAPDQFTSTEIFPISQNSFTLDDATPGQTYYFHIASINNEDSKSLYSNVASAFIKFDQTITMPTTLRIALPSNDVVIGATSTNNSIPVTYMSNNPAVASVIDGKIHPIKAGTVIITASQAGNALYNPAQDVNQLVSFSIRKGTNTLAVSNDNSNLLNENKELVITNLVTPNGDGKNDFWIIKNIDQYPNNEVKIYTTNGSLVYSKKGYQNEWDGAYNGTSLPQGNYLYIFNPGKGEAPIKGYITLVNNQ